jgi:hypothetical protein
MILRRGAEYLSIAPATYTNPYCVSAVVCLIDRLIMRTGILSAGILDGPWRVESGMGGVLEVKSTCMDTRTLCLRQSPGILLTTPL